MRPLITEGTTIDHPVSSYSESVPSFFGPALAGWRRMVDEVHEAGGRIVPQQWHVGAMRHPSQDHPNRHLPSVSPSGIHSPGKRASGEPIYDAKLGPTPEELGRFLKFLADAGVDAFHCSQRRFWEPELWRMHFD